MKNLNFNKTIYIPTSIIHKTILDKQVMSCNNGSVEVDYIDKASNNVEPVTI